VVKFRLEDFSLLLIGLFYAWYVLPVVNAAFKGVQYNIMFFSFYALGIIGLMFGKKGKIRINRIICIVATYCICIIVMALFGVADAGKHVRVGAVFFTTIILYFIVLNTEQRVKFGKYLLLIYLITCVTSSVGVILDNRVSRTISHASYDDDLQQTLNLLNIAGIYLFQCMVMLIPALYAALNQNKIFRILLILGIGGILVNASFTISLVLYMLAIIIVYYERYSLSFSKKILILSLLLCMAGIFYLIGYELLTSMSASMGNVYISARIQNIRDFIYRREITGGTLALRLEYYALSWKTFMENILGVGPLYAYNAGENGIGYHSQILDDLARYGIFAVLMYIGFFVEYNRWLTREWRKIDEKWVAPATTVLYVLFLFFNLGMRSGIESVVMTFIIPTIPEMVLSKKTKNHLVEKC